MFKNSVSRVVQPRKMPSLTQVAIVLLAIAVMYWTVHAALSEPTGLTGPQPFLNVAGLFLCQFTILYFLVYGGRSAALILISIWILAFVISPIQHNTSLRITFLAGMAAQVVIISRVGLDNRVYGWEKISILVMLLWSLVTLIIFNPIAQKIHGDITAKMLVATVVQGNTIFLLSALSSHPRCRKILEALGSYRGAIQNGETPTLVGAPVAFLFFIFSFFIAWAWIVESQRALDRVEEIAIIGNTAFRERFEEENRRNVRGSLQIAATVSNGGTDLALETQELLEVAFPSIRRIEFTDNPADSKILYDRLAKAQDPRHFNYASLVFKPLRAKSPYGQCSLALSDLPTAVFRVQLNSGGTLYVTADLDNLVSNFPFSVAVKRTDGGEILAFSDAAIDSGHEAVLVTEIAANTDDSVFLVGAHKSSDLLGVINAEPLPLNPSLRVVSFVPLDYSVSHSTDVETRTWGIVLLLAIFWTVTLGLILSSMSVAKKYRSENVTQLKAIASWFSKETSVAPIKSLPPQPMLDKSENVLEFEDEVIGDLKKRAAEVAEASSAYEEILSAFESGGENHLIFLLDSQMRLLVGGGFVDSLGIDAHLKTFDEIASSVESAYHHAFFETLSDVTGGVTDTKREISREVHIEGSERDSHHFLVHVTPYDRGLKPENAIENQTRFLVWALNIDEYVFARSRSEHASRIAMLGETAAGIAHEVNQPLNTIMLASTNCTTELNKGAPNIPHVLKRLEKIRSQVDRASKLVQSIKSHGKIYLEDVSQQDVKDDVLKAIGLVKSQIAISDIIVESRFEDIKYPMISSPVITDQVLSNVLMNAKDAILEQEDGRVEKKILIVVKQNTDKTLVSITNYGPDIKREVIDRIFDPFYSTKNPGGESGVGLGLSVCRRMMAEIGGDIFARSEGGVTTFTVGFRTAAGDG